MKKTFKKKTFSYPPVKAAPTVLRETAAELEEPTRVVNVRAAKDQLSSLLEEAASGNEVIITSDGVPKAKLVPVRGQRRRFRVDWALLNSMPAVDGAPTSEAIVRADRDGRS